MIPEDGTGVEGANAYISRTGADEYFNEHPRKASWVALTGDQKDAQIVYATRMLDASVEWKGERVSMIQSLEWPRFNIQMPGSGGWQGLNQPLAGNIWPSDVIPNEVKHAVCELAISNAVNGLSDNPTGTEGIKSLGIGKGAVVLEFDATTVRTILGRLVPLLLTRFALSTGNSMLRRIVRA